MRPWKRAAGPLQHGRKLLTIASLADDIEPRGEGYDLQSTCGESGAGHRIRRIPLTDHRSQCLNEQRESWILGTACTTGEAKAKRISEAPRYLSFCLRIL